MKKILIFLTIFLSWAWAYTSWYWYTCHIKDMCSLNLINNESIQEETQILTQDESSRDVSLVSEDEILLHDAEDVFSDWVDDTRDEVQSLSADDVTSPSPVIPPQAILIEEEDDIEESFLVWEWENNDSAQTRDTDDTEETARSTSTSTNICQNPLVWPLSIWGQNKREEVEMLERFLIGRGLLSTSDWVFWNDVLEAVKAFQEEFRAEILTPWGINNPTGYVGRTTIQKIQELACN